MSREFGRWLGAALVVAFLTYGTPLFGPACVGLTWFLFAHEKKVAGQRSRSRSGRRR